MEGVKNLNAKKWWHLMGQIIRKKTAGDVIYGVPQIVKVIWHEKLRTKRSEKITSPTAH